MTIYFLILFSALLVGLSFCEYEEYVGQLDDDTISYSVRVKQDGGKIGFFSRHKVDQFIKSAKANNYFDDIVAAYSPSWGCSKKTGKVSKLYSITNCNDIS